MHGKSLWTLALLTVCHQTGSARAEGPFRPDQFDAVHQLIKPQPGESKWARVPWLTNLNDARQRAVAEDKPLLLWRAGGGDVLGRA